MKNTVKYILGILALAATFSCGNLNIVPEFQAEDSFVAFSSPAMSCLETAGKISIPVSLASIDAKTASVTYEIAGGTAKEGVDFTLADPSAVVSINGESRSAVIDINIINREGVYTGDLSFTLKIASAGDLKVGAENTCTVTIQDLDHPLASILGTYKVEAFSNFDEDITFYVEFVKDPNDPTVVWMTDPCGTGEDIKIYGNVSADLKTISFPIPQVFPYNASYNNRIAACDGNHLYYEGVNVVLTATEDGFEAEEMAFGSNAVKVADGASAGWFELLLPPTNYIKQ